ncbi:MAG: zinc ribbon domain-containing protein [Chloroflexales bacterium]|nr:zinc ribbon domain-containing protein [Chloroflexales bacterium]
MYEYGCAACASHFDLLRRIDQDDADIQCPQCGSRHIQRQISVFAAFTKESSGSTPTMQAKSGGCCSGGACGCASRN